MRKRISNLQRRSKIFITMLIDFLSGFFVWFLFGPPGILFIAEKFSIGIIEIAASNIINFIIPITLSIGFSFIFGFYSQVIRFYDSSERLWLPAFSCFLFGFSWSYIYLSKFELMFDPLPFRELYSEIFLRLNAPVLLQLYLFFLIPFSWIN